MKNPFHLKGTNRICFELNFLSKINRIALNYDNNQLSILKNTIILSLSFLSYREHTDRQIKKFKYENYFLQVSDISEQE